MSVSIKVNSGENRFFQLEINGFPTTISVEKPNRVIPVLPFALFAAVMLLVALETGLALLLIAGLAAFLLYAYGRGQRRHVLQFDREGVQVREARLFVDRHWQARYTDFKGVVLRTRTARSKALHTTYQIIELQHPDRSKTLPLYVEKTLVEPTELWEDYARKFGIRALRA